MKKLTKRLLTIITAVVMTISMSGAVFAANQNLSVEQGTKGNTYSVYQVMKATKISAAGEADMYKYTVNDAFKPFFNSSPDYELNSHNEIVKKSDGKVLTGDARWTNTNTTDASKLAAALEKFAISNNIEKAATLTDASATSLEEGYYLVAETASGSTDQTEVASKPVLVNLVGAEAKITPKNDTVTLEKNIVEGSNKVKENAVSIGDDINYEITTKIPKYEANVDKTRLSFVLTDTFSNGLTYNNDLVIDGFVKDTDYTVAVDGQKLTITFKTDSIYDHQGAAVVAKYSAKLNENAVINGANPNDIKLDYANNTNVENSHKTLKDDVKTFTFGFGVHKVDGEDNSDLPDAEFEIRKGSANGAVVKFTKTGNTYKVDPNGTVDKVVSVAGTAPKIEGLDEGTYYMIETKAPDEYTKITDPIKIVLEGVKGADGKHTGQSRITVSGGGGATGEQGTTQSTTVTSTGNNVDINVYVKNYKGISLPETGKITSLLFMAGGLMIIAAGAAYYVASRKKKKQITN